jgi:hypothetical protein
LDESAVAGSSVFAWRDDFKRRQEQGALATEPQA